VKIIKNVATAEKAGTLSQLPNMIINNNAIPTAVKLSTNGKK
jgi:hypothetical protein